MAADVHILLQRKIRFLVLGNKFGSHQTKSRWVLRLTLSVVCMYVYGSFIETRLYVNTVFFRV